MPFEKIAVAFDGSKASRKALQKAMKLAEDNPGASLHVIHVLQYPALAFGEAFITAPASFRKDLYDYSENLMDEARQIVSVLPNATHVELAEGQPAKVILDYADRNGCDLIVLGSRGLGNIREFVLGSVSHNVVQHAKIPVLIVK